MQPWTNEAGAPLSGEAWLKAHHAAKLPERLSYLRSQLLGGTQRIIDIGCGPGHWLSLTGEVLGKDFQYVGIDFDESSIRLAKKCRDAIGCDAEFINSDLNNLQVEFGRANTVFMFNMLPYIKDPLSLITQMADRLSPRGRILVRQYDGALLRFGPLPEQLRWDIERELRAALIGSEKFKHYSMDGTIEALGQAARISGRDLTISFERFYRVSPFPDAFFEYYESTLNWTCEYLSDPTRTKLEAWMNQRSSSAGHPHYFTELDLVAVLS